MATNEEAVSLRDEYSDWYAEHKISDYIEYSEENWEKVQDLNPNLVWTDHDTCEDTTVTNGAHLFSGSCCWVTHGWHIAEVPWDGDENTYISFKAGSYLSCPSCNPEGENDEGAEDCPGDENFPECECSDGYISYYWD